jgi:hypothetical protein
LSTSMSNSTELWNSLQIIFHIIPYEALPRNQCFPQKIDEYEILPTCLSYQSSLQQFRSILYIIYSICGLSFTPFHPFSSTFDSFKLYNLGT